MLKNKRSYLVPIVGFALIILISSMILYLPICNYKELSFKNVLFTATSALTTTGFTKGPLQNQFNFLGQLVLAILMEIGAMGFIIFISYFLSVKNKKIRMSDIILINDNISSDSYASIKEHSIFIGKLMLKVQIAGIVFLALKFIPVFGILEGTWHSIFLTISAFSNTGFTLFEGESLTKFANDIYVQIVLIALMILGSIGILVIEDLKKNRKKKFNRLKLQTKIILTYTLGLLFVPMFVMKMLDPNLSLLNCLFMSATTRSTGFAITNVSNLCVENKVMLMILMFIGGSPTSTSGGVKIITIAILLSTVMATLRGKEETVMFWKRIPDTSIRKAFSILMIFIMVLSITCAIFYHLDNISLFNIMFESISAITNTGLTITDYDTLKLSSEMIIMFLMYVGRVGPLTMVLAVVNKDRKNIEYPSEDVIL